MAEALVKISTEGGVWVRQLHFVRQGDVHVGHLHSHDHVTLLAHGRLRVRVETQVQDFTAPHIIVIAKQKRHDLEALDADTVAYCVASLANVATPEIRLKGSPP